MRVLCFPSPKVDDHIPIFHSLSIAADRHVAVMHGRALDVYDLRVPEAPAVRIPDVVDHALASSCLIVADSRGTLTRWEAREGIPTAWEPTNSFSVLDTAGAASSLPENLRVSASGRYVLFESTSSARGTPSRAAAQAYLFDVLTGEVKRVLDLHRSWVRAGFACLPSGEEVLLISAESYMSVQMVGCTTGRTLHAYTAESSWDFCHTDYALTADATRLLAFGCIWGGPYEARMYDATPWTMPEDGVLSGQAVPYFYTGSMLGLTSTFPLPIVFRQEEVFGREIVLPFQPQATRDGTITSVALADLAGLPVAGPEVEAEASSDLTEMDRAIYRQLSLLPRAGTGVVIRRVNPTTGEVAGWSVAGTAETKEHNVHVLSEHRVLVVNERIQIINGLTGEIRDEGALEVPVGWFYTAPTTSGDTLIVYWSEGAPRRDHGSSGSATER